MRSKFSKNLPVAQDFQKIKCGQVFYRSPTSYFVSCEVCHEEASYQYFPQHFRTKHLEKGLDINLLDINKDNFILNSLLEKEQPIDESKIVVYNDDVKCSSSFQEVLNEDPIATSSERSLSSPSIVENIKIENEEIQDRFDYQDIIETSSEDSIQHEEGMGDKMEDDILHHDFDTDYRKNSDSEDETGKRSDKMKEISQRHMLKKALQHRRSSIPIKKKTSWRYNCTDCGKKVRSERELLSHKRTHTGIKCDECGASFKNLANLKSHKIRHTGVKAFKCGDCGKDFFTSTELKTHEVWHTLQFRFICDICAYAAASGPKLRDHMRRHTGERPYKCDNCGKCFFTRYDLNIHATSHSDARPYICDICGSTFRYAKALRVHKKTHVKERPFICEICDKGFIKEYGLKSHMRCHDGTLSKIAKITAPQIGNPEEYSIENTDC